MTIPLGFVRGAVFFLRGGIIKPLALVSGLRSRHLQLLWVVIGFISSPRDSVIEGAVASEHDPLPLPVLDPPKRHGYS